jgi:hypothetical protein
MLFIGRLRTVNSSQGGRTEVLPRCFYMYVTDSDHIPARDPPSSLSREKKVIPHQKDSHFSRRTN